MRIVPVVFAALLALDSAAQSPCAEGDRHRQGKNHEAAKAAYLKVIAAGVTVKDPGTAVCAETALREMALEKGRVAEQFALAEIALARGDKEAARAAYIAAMAIDDTSPEADDLLRRVSGVPPEPPSPDRELEIARKLLALGRRDEALKIVDELVRKSPYAVGDDLVDPYAEARELKKAGFRAEAEAATKAAAKSGKPVPAELHELAEAGWWEKTKGSLLVAAEIAAFALAIGAIILLVRRLWILQRRPRLEIANFLPDESSAPTHHTASVTAMVREALGRFAPDEPKYSIATVRETVNPLVISEELLGAIPGSLSPLVSLLPVFIQNFTRGRVIALEGRVHAPGAHGTGLTLSLTYAGSTIGSVTLWQGDFDPGTVRKKKKGDEYGAADYYALAEPAAIWLLFHLDKAPMTRSQLDLDALPTKSWRSHAYFRAGITAAARGDHHSAEALFIESLRDDPTNLAARVNFAGELMVDRDDDRSNNDFATEFAIEQLESVLNAHEKLDDEKKDDAIRYATRYRLASAHYDLKHINEALEYAEKLSADIEKNLEAATAPRSGETPIQERKRLRLKAFFEQSGPAARAMHIGIRFEHPDVDATVDELKTAAAGPVPTAQFQYNYACSLAIYLRKKGINEDEEKKYTAEAIQRLRLAIRMKEDLRARARVDRALEDLRRIPEVAKDLKEPVTAAAPVVIPRTVTTGN
jgi:tetratricopeptide (TPR) repeat protein